MDGREKERFARAVVEEMLRARRTQGKSERFRHIAVRVSGFSMRLCLLDRAMQDHIIARTKHEEM